MFSRIKNALNGTLQKIGGAFSRGASPYIQATQEYSENETEQAAIVLSEFIETASSPSIDLPLQPNAPNVISASSVIAYIESHKYYWSNAGKGAAPQPYEWFMSGDSQSPNFESTLATLY